MKHHLATQPISQCVQMFGKENTNFTEANALSKRLMQHFRKSSVHEMRGNLNSLHLEN